MFNQVFEIAMGTKCASQHACLTIGYQKETKIFTQELVRYFLIKACELIKEVSK